MVSFWDIQDGRTVTVAQVLDDAVNGMGKIDADDGTKAELLYAIGQSYYNLGLYDRAIDPLEASQTLVSGFLGSDHLDTLGVASALAEAYRKTGQYAKSIAVNERCLAQFRRQLGDAHPDTLTSLRCLESLGQLQEAEKLANVNAEIVRLQNEPPSNSP